MDSRDYFDIAVKTSPLLVKAWNYASTVLLSDQRSKVREAERLRQAGDSHYREGTYDLATYSYWESIRLNPDDFRTWLHLLRTYRAADQIPLALVAAGYALSLATIPALQSRIWTVIGLCNSDNFERSGNPEDLRAAIAAFDRAAKLDAHDIISRWQLLRTILITLAAPKMTKVASEMELQSRAVNVANDLISMLRAGDGNASNYGGRVADDVRLLSDTIKLSEFWTAQCATVESYARSQSLIDTIPIDVSKRRNGRGWRGAAGTAMFVLFTVVASFISGCAVDLTGPSSAPLLKEPSQRENVVTSGAGSQHTLATTHGSAAAATNTDVNPLASSVQIRRYPAHILPDGTVNRRSLAEHDIDDDGVHKAQESSDPYRRIEGPDGGKNQNESVGTTVADTLKMPNGSLPPGVN